MTVTPDTSLPLAIVVFASLWLVLSAAVSAAYPAVKSVLPAAPKQRAAVLLVLCTAPLFISFAITTLEFSAKSLIDPHCHLDCEPHVPAVLGEVTGWILLTLAVVLAGSLLCHLCRRISRERHLGQILNAVAPQSRGNFRLFDSSEALAFSAGVFKPWVFVSQGLVQNVSSEELKAIIEHEHAHGRRRDNLQRLLAFLCTFPSLSQKRLLTDLNLAAEQCCDAAAARALDDPLLVAQVLVKVQKLQCRSARKELCGFDGSNIEARVDALLQPAKEPTPLLLVVLLAGALGLIILAPEPLHHLVERVLDSLHLAIR